MSASSQSLQPSFTGYVANTTDALKLFEACLTGTLHHVARRPHNRERNQLIRSGCVFIYEENTSGIKRRTDRVPWSPSRILENFLVYHELLKPSQPGEKKRAIDRNKRRTKPGEPYPRNDSITSDDSTALVANEMDRDKERSLIGSWVDSYSFKTMRVTVQGVHYHLISYYKVKDVISKALRTPSEDPMLQQLKPRLELTSRQNFRVPMDEVDDALEGQMDAERAAYPYGDRGGHNRRLLILNSQMYQPQLLEGKKRDYYSMEANPYSAAHQPPLQDLYYPAQPVAPESHIKQQDYYASNPSYPAHYEQSNSNITPVWYYPDGRVYQLLPRTFHHTH